VTLFETYLAKVEGMVEKATAAQTTTAPKLNRVVNLVLLVKLDIPRMVRMLRILKAQRDGYRRNYWAVTGIVESEQKEIGMDNDAEINDLIKDGLLLRRKTLVKRSNTLSKGPVDADKKEQTHHTHKEVSEGVEKDGL
jgi:hypothetical protein